MHKSLFYNFLIVLLLGACSCKKEDGSGGGGEGGKGIRKTLKLTEFVNLNKGEDAINSHADSWDYSSMKMDYSSYVEVTNGVQYPKYPRLRTLPDGSYILFWHSSGVDDANGKDTHYSLSKDLKTWEYMGYLWKSYDVVTSVGTNDVRYFTNPNGIVLSNGELLAIAAFRAVKAYSRQDAQSDQGLIVKRSKDGGRTWFGETEIYHGPCWEAHLIELPSGQIQAFYSESRPWISSSHSGTGMVYSDDGGATWSPKLGDHMRVMRKQWWNIHPSVTKYGPMYCFTYQMPVGVILNNSNKFAFAMESANEREVKSSGDFSDHFSIAIAFSKDDGKWENLQNEDVLPREQRIDSLVSRGAAPYLIQFPSGECLLAYGGTDSKQHMMTGNEKATEFSAAFDGLPYKGSWGGLEMTSSHQAISYMRNVRISSAEANIQIARFNLNHNIVASKHPVTVDTDNSDWFDTDDALFVGSKGQARGTLRCSCDESNVYFLVEVLDETLSVNDFCTIFLTPSEDRFKAASRRIKVNYNGLKSVTQYSGSWREVSSGAKALGAYDGDPTTSKDMDNGYLVEISVPRAELSLEGGKTLVNFALFDSAANAEDSVKDTNTPSKWLTISGL